MARAGTRLVEVSLLAVLLAGCASVARVDACAKADSWGRHHGRVLAGPRVTWKSGVEAAVLAGYQSGLYWPGEPHESARAPTDEFQVQAEVSVPLWRKRDGGR